MRLPAGTYNVRYTQDMAIVRTRLQWVILVLGFIILFTCPLYLPQYLNLVNLIAITIISVTGLMMLTGYCGQISLGHAAFMMVGAYITAWMSRAGLPFLLVLPVAGLATAVVGLVFAAPAVRVKGFYLAMSTLAAQFIIPWIIVNIHPEFTGGSHTLRVTAAAIAGYKFISQTQMFYLIAPITCLMVWLAKNLVRTRPGRAWVAIRDNDLAAEVSGINVFRYKVLAFFIASFYAGVAGCLWAYWMRSVAPSYFELITSIWFLGMIILGGMGSITGAVVGAIVIRVLDYGTTTFVTTIMERTFPMLSTQIIAGTSPFVFGLIILLIIVFEPRGINHRWNIFKSSYRLFPFSY